MPARANKTQYAVLGMLSLGLRTGYEMKAFVEGSLDHFWTESYGQLYPVLRKLVEEGLATVELEAQEGKPDRKAYELTDAGRQALTRWLERPVEPQPSRNELLLKLFFGERAAPGVCAGHVREAQGQLERELATYERIERDLRERAAGHPELPYWLITLSFGKHQARALRGWCEETTAALEALGSATGEATDDGNVHD